MQYFISILNEAAPPKPLLAAPCDMTGVRQVWPPPDPPRRDVTSFIDAPDRTQTHTRILKNRLPMTRFRRVLSLIPIDYRQKMAQRIEVTLQRLTRRTYIADLLRVASNSPLGHVMIPWPVLRRVPAYCQATESFTGAGRNTGAAAALFSMLFRNSVIAMLL